MIDVGGFTRLTEKTIWQAIESSGIPYAEWMIRKEYQGRKPVLHLYLEARDGVTSEDIVAGEIHARLKEIDPPYKELEEMTGLKPLRVSLLSEGTFRRFFRGETGGRGRTLPISSHPTSTRPTRWWSWSTA